MSEQLLDSLAIAALLGALAGFLYWVLRRYRSTRRVSTTVLLAASGWALFFIVGGISTADDDLLLKSILAISVLLTANIGVQLLDLLIWDLVQRQAGVRRFPRLLIEIFNVLVMVIAALVVLSRVFEVELSGLLVTSTVVSAVIGLALQDMLGNVVSGLALQFDRPFDIDDWIRINGQEGVVTEMKWRTVTLRSIDNQSIVIPNSSMVQEDITNYSRPTATQRLHLRVGLPYGAAPGDVKKVLLPAVQDAPGVSADPPSDVLAEEYGESAIIYDIRYWITDYSRTPEIRDEVLSRVWYALKRAGISVPFPIRDVNLYTVQAEAALAERDRTEAAAFAALRPLPIFAPLDDEQIAHLAQNARLQRFYVGESLVRQGAEGDSLFVMQSGQARVEFKSKKGGTRILAQRVPGDFFGEMSLLTGEKRSASVIAESDVEVVVVDKAALAEAVSSDLTSLEALSEIVEERLKDMRQFADEDAVASERETASLFSRIARFLGFG